MCCRLELNMLRYCRNPLYFVLVGNKAESSNMDYEETEKVS